GAGGFGGRVLARPALGVTTGGSQRGRAPAELRVVLELSGSPAQVGSREQLRRAVWGHDYLGDSRIVDACVQRLRAKVEDTPSEPVYIQTVRGFGYRFGPV